MATAVRARTAGNALILLLGAAVFLNYVDRGAIAIAAPVLKPELGLSATEFGIAVSAFFWVYAPVQLVAGWLCDRLSVYRLLAGGIVLWAVSTMLMGFAGGFASLLVLRIMLGVGESIAFPGCSKIIARHVPAERRGIANAAVAAGIALGPAVGTLAGGLIVASFGWRAMFVVFGLATLLWLVPWLQAVRGAADLRRISDEGARGPMRPTCSANGRCGRCRSAIARAITASISCSPGCRLYLDHGAGLHHHADDAARNARLFRARRSAPLSYGQFSDRWTRSGRSEATVPPLDDGRRARRSPRSPFSAWLMPTARSSSAIVLCLAGAASASLVAQPLRRRPDVRRPARRRDLGRRSRMRSAICRALSARSSPASSSTRAGYGSAFVLTAAVAAFGAFWWAVGVPPIRQVDLPALRLNRARPSMRLFHFESW